MDCLLHIGTEKTGTTSIQEFLYLNKGLLKKQGIHLLCSAGKKNAREMVRYVMRNERDDDFFSRYKINTRYKQRIFYNKFIKKFDRELSKLTSKTKQVIITSEHFHSQILFDDELVTLKALLEPYFNRIIIVVYLRSPIEMARSLYSTAIRNKFSLTNIDDFLIKNCRPQKKYYNYLSLLERWSKVFSSENLIATPFSPKYLYKKNLLYDFCRKATIELASDKFVYPARQNQELSYIGQQTLLRLNKKALIENRGMSRCNEEVYHIIAKDCVGEGERPTQELVRLINKRFHILNKALYTEWFSEIEENPFEVDISKYPKEKHELSLETAQLIDSFIHYIKQIEEKSISKMLKDKIRKVFSY